jgi:UDP-4-amino-4,6-dideoxy-N-acetyl-beta-L-altrosamine transaminase
MMIPYGRQDVTAQDIEAVAHVLCSEWLTQGPTVPRFEEAVATRVGARHAVAVNSATSALHIACLALGLGPGDRLWTSPNTFVASANCALYCRATVDFVDIDARTYNLSTAALAAKLESADRAGALPKVVVPVHFGGQSCEMFEIRELSRRYGFRIIEDASHAVGGRYRGARVGDCAYSDITIFSFHPVKIITSAEGGMALTNDPELAATMRRLRTHGITRDPAQMTLTDQGGWYYEQIDLGFNYRMTDVQAALGLSQHSRLDQFISRRREIAGMYDQLLGDLPVVRPFRHKEADSAFHLYVIQVDPVRVTTTRGSLIERLRNQGIGASVHYIPVHTQPYYRRMGFQPGHCPVAECYYHHAITLPMFAALEDGDITRVVNALREALSD